MLIERRVVNPLAKLVRQTKDINRGQSDELLSTNSNEEEISELVRTFNQLLIEMRRFHHDLHESSLNLRKANKQIEDSIRYAGILQRSILPDRQLNHIFGERYFFSGNRRISWEGITTFSVKIKNAIWQESPIVQAMAYREP